MGCPCEARSLPIALKLVTDTLWSAYYAPSEVLQAGIDGVVNALDEICDSN